MWTKAKEKQRPHTFQTDGLIAYDFAFRKVFGTRCKDRKVTWIRNVQSVSGKYNVRIERLWGIIKDRINAMRGFGAAWSAPILLNAIVFYYNFVRMHGSIKITPAEAAGIKAIEGSNRWMEWIRKE